MINSENNLIMGMTFSDGAQIYNENGDKNLFEQIITVNTIEEDENLSKEEKVKLLDILNSEKYSPFQKRIMIMRTLDREKEFSSKIGLILKERPSKMEMVKKIMLVFRDHYTKNDVLKKKFGEVLTSVETVRDMVKEIDDDFWKSPYNEDGTIKRVLESSNGSGVFLWMVIYKFMVGLESDFPDENERYKFIVENMVYACELQKSKMFNWLCIADIYDEFDLNVYCGSFLEEGFDNHMRDIWNLKEGDFSLVISNPPYQKMDGGAKASAKPIYNLFTLKAIKLSQKVLFITPSRWFAGGKGLDSFRKFMMESNKIRSIKDFPGNGSEIFGNSVNIGGGVSYFLFDKNYNGNCNFNNLDIDLSKYDIIIRDTKSYKLIDKISKFKSIESICKPRSFYGVQTNDNRLIDDKIDENYITCYVSQQKGFKKFIKKSYLDINKINIHKVATPRALGNPEDGLGNIFYVDNNSIVSDSYMFILSENYKESESIISYLKTNFVHYFICLRKIDSSIKPSTFRWVPIVPFDRIWNDEMLFDYFNLNHLQKIQIMKILK